MDISTIIELLLKALDGRSGFDAWWGSLDSTTREDIRRELEDTLEGCL